MPVRLLSGRPLSGRVVLGRTIGLRSSGGGAVTPSIPGAMSISWDEVDADSTPGFDIAFDAVSAGDLLRIQWSIDSGAHWTDYLTHILSSGDIESDFTVSGVTPLSDGSYIFRARLERSGHAGEWSDTTSAHIDAPPTITSSNTVSVAENSSLGHLLTANESITWAIAGGADQAQFEISVSTLRWLSNGSRNFESPQDADADNAYVVTVRATDLSALTTDQTITVTVTNLPVEITSASSANVASGSVLSHALTADVAVTWAITGGNDQAQFEISGSTLRWLANGTRNYLSPGDSDSDNVYVVSVQATDGSFNAATQVIHITVQAQTGSSGTSIGLLLAITRAGSGEPGGMLLALTKA